MLTAALHELELGGLNHKIPWIILSMAIRFGARAKLILDGAC